MKNDWKKLRKKCEFWFWFVKFSLLQYKFAAHKTRFSICCCVNKIWQHFIGTNFGDSEVLMNVSTQAFETVSLQPFSMCMHFVLSHWIQIDCVIFLILMFIYLVKKFEILQILFALRPIKINPIKLVRAFDWGVGKH